MQLLRRWRFTPRPMPSRSASSAPDAATAFRRWGHLEATLDPLELHQRPRRPELSSWSSPDIARLREVYSGAIGAEFEHLDSLDEREWWATKLERLVPERGGFSLSTAQRRNVNTLLTQAEQFEHFVAKKFASFKRYSGEGTESMLPALDAILGAAAE